MGDSKKKYEDLVQSGKIKSVKDIQVADYEYVMASQAERDDAENQRRIDLIAQNGNEGLHYQQSTKKPLLSTKYRKLEASDFAGNKGDKGEGLRFNSDKSRYDLLHPVAQAGIVSVLTAGANKYAPRNWEKGMNWSTVLASLKRHIAAIELGEDYDKETGLLHIDHVQCNAHFLSAYYKIFPQGDDRRHKYLELPKVGLDIDEVLADFVGGLMKRFPDTVDRAVYWNDYKLQENFKEVINDESFWLELETKVDSLPFEPHCYITSRPCSTEITEKWLASKGFPKAPVYTVGLDKSKVEVAREAGIDVFVDDAYHNFVELNKAGILCYLYNAPHNERYDVGHKRIKNLEDLM
jgi:hypothetical protein